MVPAGLSVSIVMVDRGSVEDEEHQKTTARFSEIEDKAGSMRKIAQKGFSF